jgi:hypothetical protein
MAETPEPFSTSHVRKSESFKKIEEQARAVLREQGLTDDEIEAELNRTHRGLDD